MKSVCYFFLVLLLPTLAATAQTPALEVENSTGATLFQVNTDGSLIVNPQGATNGHVLTTDASGNATWQASAGGFMLPFSGSWDQLPAAFSLSKTAGGGDLMTLRNNTGGRALWLSMTGGVPGSVGMFLQSSHGGFQVVGGNGIGVDVSNNSTSPALRAVNNGSGLAGAFQGDVSVTGVLSLEPSGLSCTGCVGSDEVQDNTLSGIDVLDGTLTGNDIANGTVTGADVQNGSLTASDVDATSGFYVSKTQLYKNDVPDTIPGNGIRFVEAACADANDLPLFGDCDGPSGAPVFLLSITSEDWTSTTNPASVACTFRSETVVEENVEASITCIGVD